MNLTLRQLRYFVAIVEAESMARAASALRIAPTALSSQMRLIEEQHGVELLERHSRGVRPTLAGELFARRARTIIELAHLAEDELTASGRGGRRTIRLGILPSVAHTMGASLMTQVAAKGGGMELQIIEQGANNLWSILNRSEADFILSAEVRPSPEFEVLELLADRLVFVTAAGSDERSIEFGEAIGSNLVNYRDDDVCWQMLDRAASARGRTLRSAYLVESVQMIRQMVIDGLATAIVPYAAFLKEHQAGLVSVRTIADEALHRQISLAWRRDAGISPETDSFIDIVKDAVSILKARIGTHAPWNDPPSSNAPTLKYVGSG